jgi:hypothetical protein
MPKTKTKQQSRDAIQLTVAAQEFAKVLFPDHVNDVEAMETAEDCIYDLINDNPEASEEEIMADISKAIEATKAVNKTVTPDNVFLMFDRMMKKDMF